MFQHTPRKRINYLFAAITNLTKAPKNAVEVLKASLKGIPWCPGNEVFRIESSRGAGHVMAISKAMKKFDSAGLVSSKPCPEQIIVLGMIAHRLIDPCSKLATAKRMKNTSLCTEFNLPEDLDENDIYKAMDWLVHRQRMDTNYVGAFRGATLASTIG